MSFTANRRWHLVPGIGLGSPTCTAAGYAAGSTVVLITVWFLPFGRW
jgi:hypothetical protein